MRLHVLPAIVSSQEGPLQEALYTHIILCSSECTLGKKTCRVSFYKKRGPSHFVNDQGSTFRINGEKLDLNRILCLNFFYLTYDRLQASLLAV
jgi:hypothetical protein